MALITLTVTAVNFKNVSTAYTMGFQSDRISSLMANNNSGTITGNSEFRYKEEDDTTENVYAVSETVAAIQAEASEYGTSEMASAMGGDMVLNISPATVASSATTAAWSRTVTATLATAAGATHTWLNAAYTTKLSIGDTAAGTATIASTTITFVNGVATIVVSGTGTFAAASTDTLTIANLTIMGSTITGGTSVETFS